jgi:putative ABC transport system ATP-binding protein
MSTDPVLALTDLEFGYAPKQTIISINRFDIGRGESVFLRGPSGSGKSTLLGLMGGILEPGSGRIEICGTDMTSASATGRDKLRAHHMGIIFQQLNLLPYLDVIANVTLPCRFSQNRAAKAASSDGTAEAAAKRLLSELGLPEDCFSRPVSELSVGQQQRVAVARSLIGSPDLIIADEPTSALDTANRDRFIELLNTQRAQTGCSLLFVSHDESLARHFDRSVELSDLNQAAVPA